MARKSRYEKLVESVDRALDRVLNPPPIGDPPPRRGTKTLTAAVYNANWTKAFEETIVDIRPGSWKVWYGTVKDSFGRNGKTVAVWYNPTRQCWQYGEML